MFILENKHNNLEKQRLPQLDSWRCIGPLFSLSGILITHFLYNVFPIKTFLIKSVLIYFAFISYALYVIHPLLAHATWLGDGESVEKYLKRPLLFLVLFLCAHVPTFYYEQKWTRLARNLTRKST